MGMVGFQNCVVRKVLMSWRCWGGGIILFHSTMLFAI